MSDLISRQAAIDAVNEYMKAMCDYIGTPNDTVYYSYARGILIGVRNNIIALPTIQPAEPQIIRCKDCKNWDTTWTNDFSPNYHYCPMVDGVCKEDWFCADAERRTDE